MEISATEYSLLISGIKSFKPFRRYKFENEYQIDLARHLKKDFPDVSLEVQIGSSRPDIVIGGNGNSGSGIAIEIKGPTTTRELQTISDKILRYSNNFKTIFIVLFDIQMTPVHYEEWLAGMERHHPQVKILNMSEIYESLWKEETSACQTCYVINGSEPCPTHKASKPF